MRRYWDGALLAAAAWSPATAYAQTLPNSAPQAQQQGEGLGDIVVTAQRRDERSQAVPISLTALSAKELQERRVDSVADLDSISPSLRVSTADASANPHIFIRGIGLDDVSPTASSGVGMYIDGVYVGSLLAQLAGFYDLTQVEVLNGPQGTLFGKNTTGGAINITTQQPTFATKANLSLDYGRFNEVDAQAGVGGTLIENLVAFRIAGMYHRSDGDTLNTYDNTRVNNIDQYAGRLSLLITPDSQTKITISANGFWNRGGTTQSKSRDLIPASSQYAGKDGLCAPKYYYTAHCSDAVGYSETNANPYDVDANIDPSDDVTVHGVSANATRQFGAISLVSITAYSSVHRDAWENTDANPLDELQIYRNARQHQFTQELRLQGREGALTWVAGGFFEHETISNLTGDDILDLLRPLFTSPANPTGASLANSVGYFTYPSTQTTNSYAAFGQADYAVTDRITLTGGLRWSTDIKSFDYTAQFEGADLFHVNEHKTFSGVSGRAGIRYQPNSDINIYATFNHGYKSGGFFSDSADDPAQVAPVKNETVNAYEIGSKIDLLHHKLRINSSAFYYNYSDIQAFALETVNGLTEQVLSNAASARIYGGEIQVTARPVPHLDVSASAAYLHANYGTFVSSDGDSYTGNAMSHSPRWNLAGDIKYTFDLPNGGAIVPRLDGTFRTRDYFDATETVRVSDGNCFLLNGEIAWAPSHGGLRLGAWAKNLTNHVYYTGISPIDSLGFDEVSYGQPRTYGIFARFTY